MLPRAPSYWPRQDKASVAFRIRTLQKCYLYVGRAVRKSCAEYPFTTGKLPFPACFGLLYRYPQTSCASSGRHFLPRGVRSASEISSRSCEGSRLSEYCRKAGTPVVMDTFIGSFVEPLSDVAMTLTNSFKYTSRCNLLLVNYGNCQRNNRDL